MRSQSSPHQTSLKQSLAFSCSKMVVFPVKCLHSVFFSFCIPFFLVCFSSVFASFSPVLASFSYFWPIFFNQTDVWYYLPEYAGKLCLKIAITICKKSYVLKIAMLESYVWKFAVTTVCRKGIFFKHVKHCNHLNRTFTNNFHTLHSSPWHSRFSI